MSQTFPIRGYDPADVRAWLTPEEARMLQALRCQDLLIEIDVAVSLPERRGQKRNPPPTPGQRAREAEAAGLLRDASKALANVPAMLQTIARLRAQLEEAKK